MTAGRVVIAHTVMVLRTGARMASAAGNISKWRSVTRLKLSSTSTVVDSPVEEEDGATDPRPAGEAGPSVSARLAVCEAIAAGGTQTVLAGAGCLGERCERPQE